LLAVLPLLLLLLLLRCSQSCCCIYYLFLSAHGLSIQCKLVGLLLLLLLLLLRCSQSCYSAARQRRTQRQRWAGTDNPSPRWGVVFELGTRMTDGSKALSVREVIIPGRRRGDPPVTFVPQRMRFRGGVVLHLSSHVQPGWFDHATPGSRGRAASPGSSFSVGRRG
jgi:hypothetical protein